MPQLSLKLVKEIVGQEDTIYPNFGTQDMAHEFTQKVRGISVAPRTGDSMWVYRPQDTYAMGYIGYCQVHETGDQEQRYAVFSPNIHNGKYNYGEKQHMASALHRLKGVANAAKHLRPLTTKQVLALTQGEFVSALFDAKSTARSQVAKATQQIEGGKLFALERFRKPDTTPLQDELQRILNSDYVFVDKELEAQLYAAFAAVAEHEESKKLHAAKHTFIEVIEANGRNTFRGFAEVDDDRSLFRLADTQENLFYFTQEELPDRLMGAMSVLSMVEVGIYVSGVGYRAANNMFYVRCE
jgi:hypothetical protein